MPCGTRQGGDSQIKAGVAGDKKKTERNWGVFF